MKKSQRTVAIILVLVLLLGLAGTGAMFIFGEKEYKGNADAYNLVTLQIEDNLFYKVHVPVEANLLSTDGATVYEFDLLTVGIQDTEPTSYCKVKVGDRWVFATSEDDWLKATMSGFETETAFSATYDASSVNWSDTIPSVIYSLDTEMLEELRNGHAYALGGEEFIVTQVAYGTFDTAVGRSLLKMSALYGEPLTFGMMGEKKMWMSSNRHTVAVSSINYNTCLVISSFGGTGRQYAAALMGD